MDQQEFELEGLLREILAVLKDIRYHMPEAREE